MADQFYFENGEYFDGKYFGYIAEAEISISSAFAPSFTVDIADTTGYYIPDYIQEGYFESGVVQEAQISTTSTATIAVSASRIQQGAGDLESQGAVTALIGFLVGAECDMGALFTPSIDAVATINAFAILDGVSDLSATVSKFSGNEATLENLVNLSLQGARSRDYQSSLSSSFTQSSTESRTRATSSSITSTASITTDAQVFKDIPITLTTAFSVTANVNELEKVIPFGRPNNWQLSAYNTTTSTETVWDFEDINFSSGLFATRSNFDASVKKHGTASWFFNSPGTSQGYAGFSDVLTLFNSIDQTDDNDHIKANEDFVVELWYRQNIQTASRFLYYSDTKINTALKEAGLGNPNEDDVLFFVGIDSNNKFTAQFRTQESGYPTYTLTGTTTVDADTWYHVAFRRVNGVVQLVVNNSVEDTESNSSAFRTNAIEGAMLQLVSANSAFSNQKRWFDSVAFRKGNSDITGYTSVPVGDYDTQQVLSYFDNNWDDEITFQFNLDTTLFGIASLTASAGINALASADLSTTASINADVEIIKQGDAQLSSEGALTGTATRIQPATATLESSSTVTAAGVQVKQAQATLSSESATSTTVLRIRPGAIDTESIATQLTAVGVIGDFFINAETAASLTADAVVKAGAVIALDSAFTLTPDTTLYKEFDVAMSSAFAQTADETLFKGFDATLNSAVTTETQAIKTAVGASNMLVDSALTAESLPIRNVGASLSTQFTQTADVARTRDSVADIAIEFTQTTNAIKSVLAQGTLDAEFAQSIEYLRRRETPVTTESIASQLSIAVKIADYFINMDNVAQVNATGLVTRGNSALLESTATVDATPSRTRPFESSQTTSATLTAVGITSKDMAADLDATSTQNTNAVKTVDANASLGGTGTFAVLAVATRNNEVQTFTTASLGADVARTRDTSSNNNAIVTLSTTASKQVNSSAQVNTASTLTVSAKILRIDAIVYTMPAESREYIIVAETREATVT